ncbi:glycoside hydrolase family 43 protein [Ferruginibacter albus]|uniref:glycoside hydrolase family 43 protein n=1 Tax=Ferruginibacter albus TaxID=2875540 RepID=UPI001CC57E84|nr:glycoside hydrolase 43 family protein [Ferruginibacter albus]UAY50927.1 glycoside hydrolase 43 family protein [Ferruginibacter albus]
MKKITLLLFLTVSYSLFTIAQTNYVSKVWVADNGDGTYKNPVINADYSDPDAIRVGDDYYMIASSFDAVPCLPILHSKDLVNWTIIGHALQRQIPVDHFSKVQHGNGIWASAIRYHNNEFYIYYPDPDFGIYLTKAKNINGPWSTPTLVQAGKGLIDPCPLWDDNGNAYLVHAFAGSRAGIKSMIMIKKLNAASDKVIDTGVFVYDGHKDDPTIEGPKFYKHNGYYYIFAPAGGVKTGWQLVLRSKNIYGPYERKVVMDQGSTTINGPHQGAWIQTQTGEDWFLHFQDKYAYGRVVHLQPMQWKDDWPVIGIDKDGDGKGEPVLTYKKPNVGKVYPICTPQETDEFNDTTLGLQWQWQANSSDNWSRLTGKELVLNAIPVNDSIKNYWDIRNVLSQKFPAEEFTAITKVEFHPSMEGDKTGLMILSSESVSLFLIKKEAGIYLGLRGLNNNELVIKRLDSSIIYLKATINKPAVCSFSYSEDDKNFKSIPQTFFIKPGRWIGAKIGLFCISKENQKASYGCAYFDWFRINKDNIKKKMYEMR